MNHLPHSLTRRSFAAGAVSAVSSTRVAGANDRIRLGVIGAGARAWGHVRDFTRRPDTEVIALCDVFRSKAERVAGEHKITPFLTQDHRRVLDRKDVDGVVIAVCDHQHVPILLDALHAGKDSYVEKPMTHRMEDGPRVVRAVLETKRMVQVGTQQRSGRKFLEAKERFIDSGVIGQVKMVRTWWLGNTGYLLKVPKGFRYDPADLDWKRFLGPAPQRAFDAQRYFCWYHYSDYSTGQLGGLMVHTFDVVHTLLGLKRPSSVVASGGIFQYPEDRDTADTIGVLAEYPEKVCVTFDAALATPRRFVDAEFHGTGGVLNIFRERYTFRPADPAAPVIEMKGEGCEAPHLENWVRSIRSRKQPNADVSYSHYLAAACHMGNLSYATRQRVDWNPAWDVPEVSA
ncbi:MAG: Gfo/Idh/MocA family oxidoreductase [Acidobacteria bacterium]|nr:Gfo/Idh/MocA family oxidoreductase [Acidobacteriota bacterium]